VVAALRTFAFSGPDLKTPVACHLVQNAAVTVVATFEKRNLRYAELSDGTYTVLRHLAPLGTPPEPDYVSVAEAYVGIPYLWGGRTSLGIDCSALVQVALARAGVKAPRDTDVQEATLGAPVDWKGDVDALVRGDLVFWKGHVGMVAGPNRLLHANGFHMATAFEPIDAAIARIAASGIAVRAVRRP
jgi:cell wall-associated NlpC family hydrolase